MIFLDRHFTAIGPLHTQNEVFSCLPRAASRISTTIFSPSDWRAAPKLASAGFRVIVPYLRGYGTTRFLSSDTLRNGQPSALAVDIIALMDALKIEKAILAGFDWGARTVNLI